MSSKAPPPKGVRSMSSLAAELAASDNGQELEIRQTGLRLVSIWFERIAQFRGHPFRLYTKERLADMVESIRQNGILMPLIVRRIFGDTEHDYEMLSSEKAAVLSLCYLEMFSQGKRNDILRELRVLEGRDGTCGTEFQKFSSRDELGGDYDLSGRQVAKYLRINPMRDILKLKLDCGSLTLNSAVSLSYLSWEDQLTAHSALDRYRRKPSDDQMAAVRKLAESGPLTEQGVLDLLRTPKAPVNNSVNIRQAVYSPYFAPGTTKKEIERVIGEALALYFNQPRGDRPDV